MELETENLCLLFPKRLYCLNTFCPNDHKCIYYLSETSCQISKLYPKDKKIKYTKTYLLTSN